MRNALFLLLAGCGSGQLASAAPPSKETIVQALERYDALSVKRDAGMAAKVDGLAETVGNNTAELEAVKEELKAVKASVDGLNKLLTADTEISLDVPQAANPPAPPANCRIPTVDAPPSGPTLNGKPLDVAATIQAHYRRMWTFPGSIDAHLAEHGVKGADGLDYETKRRLHSALHEMGNAPAKTAVVKAPPPVVYRAPVQNCPNGRCPNVQYGYQQPRQRLFGRWR